MTDTSNDLRTDDRWQPIDAVSFPDGFDLEALRAALEEALAAGYVLVPVEHLLHRRYVLAIDPRTHQVTHPAASVAAQLPGDGVLVVQDVGESDPGHGWDSSTSLLLPKEITGPLQSVNPLAQE